MIRYRLLAVAALLAALPALSGCIVVGLGAALGIGLTMTDKGTKMLYEAPVEDLRTALDGVVTEEDIEIQHSEGTESTFVCAGRTSDDRRVRVEFLPWDDASQVVFIKVGVIGDNAVETDLHQKLARRLR